MSQLQDTTLLAPFEIWEVPLDEHRTIKFHEPLMLTPFWLEDDPDDPDENEYLAVEYPLLGISSFGKDREELWRCILGDIRETWEHYVRLADARLSREGQKIKNTFLTVAEEVSDD